ncbi:MAG: hypothetical protein MUF81_01655 [Verrucomicrobia bacterium]|jgi:hypothetical protein|nr:hypothetical protein [Verrucomicrobiota bacterium]
MGDANFNSNDYSKSQSGLLLPNSLNIKSEHESKGINQADIALAQKVGELVTRGQLDDKLKLMDSELKLRASESNGQLITRLASVEQGLDNLRKDVQRVEGVSNAAKGELAKLANVEGELGGLRRDVQRVETSAGAQIKEFRDAKRWAITLMLAVVLGCAGIVAKFWKSDAATGAPNGGHQSPVGPQTPGSELKVEPLVQPAPKPATGHEATALPPTNNLLAQPLTTATN